MSVYYLGNPNRSAQVFLLVKAVFLETRMLTLVWHSCIKKAQETGIDVA